MAKSDKSSLEVREVKPVTEDSSASDLAEQDKALLHYRVTGEVGDYCDPQRDQEPDIAPEFGVAPHPELANPPAFTPAATRASGQVVAPFEDKVKNAPDASEEGSEALSRHATSDESPKSSQTDPGR